jgi:hypothetical protein
MAPIQVPMIIMGQISHIFILMILILILIIENIRLKRYNIKYPYFFLGIILGLSISFKPFAILIIPLLVKLIIRLKNGKIKIQLKELITFLFGLFITHVINLIYFLFFPELIQDFLTVNSSTQILDYPSSSLTRIISVALNSYSIEPILMLILTIILYGFMYSVYLFVPNQIINYPAYIGMVLLIVMINFTDSWFLNFLIFFMLIFPGVFQFEDELNRNITSPLSKKLKFSNFVIYKVIIYGIVYFSVGVIIGWTILPTDIILPFLLIILYFNLLWRLYRKKIL